MKYLKISSYVILILALLSLHTFFVKKHTLSPKDDSTYGSIINGLASIPALVNEVVSSNEVKGIPNYYIATDSAFQPFNKLSENIFGSYSIFNKETGEWEVHLHNFKTEETLHKWAFKEANYNNSKSPRLYTNSEVANPIILADSSVLAGHIGSYNFLKLDKNSNILWKNNDYFVHHSANLDSSGNVWICGRKENAQTYHSANKNYTKPYMDDLIVQLDGKTGSAIFEKSVIEILKSNHYQSYAFGMNGTIKDQLSKSDPIHLNDIQPVLTSGKYAQEGDVWVSMRNNSTIFLYRPSTNKIIHLINGPLIHQHDVDVINDSIISIFNNNYVTHHKGNELNTTGRIDTLKAVQMLTYNIADQTFTNVLEDELNRENIFTPTEGLAEFTNTNYLYIEAQNYGKIYFFKGDQLEYRNYFNNDIEGYTETPHWVRIYSDLNFFNGK